VGHFLIQKLAFQFQQCHPWSQASNATMAAPNITPQIHEIRMTATPRKTPRLLSMPPLLLY